MLFLLQLLNDALSFSDLAATVVNAFCPRCHETSPYTVINNYITVKADQAIVGKDGVIYNNQENVLRCKHCQHWQPQFINITPETTDEYGYITSASITVTGQTLTDEQGFEIIGYIDIIGGPKIPLVVHASSEGTDTGKRQGLAVTRIPTPPHHEWQTGFKLPIPLNRLPGIAHNLSNASPKIDLDLTTGGGDALDRMPEGVDLFRLQQAYLETRLDMLMHINAAQANALHKAFEAQQKLVDQICELVMQIQYLTSQLATRQIHTVDHYHETNAKLALLRQQQIEHQRNTFQLMTSATRQLLGPKSERPH